MLQNRYFSAQRVDRGAGPMPSVRNGLRPCIYAKVIHNDEFLILPAVDEFPFADYLLLLPSCLPSCWSSALGRNG